MNREDTLAMVSHYVGHAILNARLDLDDGKEGDNYRQIAIEHIRGLTKIDIVEKYIGLLDSNYWKDIGDVDEFEEKYNKLNPQADGVGDVARNLFKKGL
ncbi:MAG: hypothetical protein Q7S33_05795 [Nanoarchaeota archaeon]|nr:hypothetical protein [Nanoarchaeota archaeon]